MSERTDLADEASVVHAASKNRYEVWAGTLLAGFTQYVLPDDEHVDFVHTEIDESFSGQGLGSRLVAAAIADVARQRKRVIPHCPYVAAWLTRHHEFDDIVTWP